MSAEFDGDVKQQRLVQGRELDAHQETISKQDWRADNLTQCIVTAVRILDKDPADAPQLVFRVLWVSVEQGFR